MKPNKGTTRLALALCASLSTTPIIGVADDIDIFTGASAGKAANPRILIVLDNTSNWSRQSQKWPDGNSQGQSEAAAIQAAITKMDGSVNVGLMEFVTGGNANDDGGFIRHAITPMDTANKAALNAKLTTIKDNINEPAEKRNSNTAYGNLMYDVYNYFAGENSHSPSATLSSKADADGYTATYTRFKAPFDAAETCGKAFMIFIGNSDSNGPTADSAANMTALTALTNKRTPGGALVAVNQLGLPDYSVENVSIESKVGVTKSCYADATAAKVEVSNYATACTKFTEGCSIGTPANSATPLACPDGKQSYTVVQKVTTPASAGGTTTSYTRTAPTTGVYASPGSVGTDHGGLTCPAASGNTTYTCTYTVGAAIGTANTDTTTATSASCYAAVGTGTGNWDPATSTDRGGLSCPSGSSCTYSGVMAKKSDKACAKNTGNVTISQAATPLQKYTIEQKVTSTVGAGGSPATTTTNTLGMTSQCYSAAPATTNDYASSCTGTNVSCSYEAPTSATVGFCPAGQNLYNVVGIDIEPVNTPTGTTVADTATFNADEWARMLYEKGVPVAGSTIRPSVSTYTIDVYNAQPNAVQTSLLLSMANNGGGKYFAARSQQDIIDALNSIIVEIQSVNSAFASTSLPVNATNRSQSMNQVFIGMFRPDPDAKPRWPGNLKQYKLMMKDANVELADQDNLPAVNGETGFITPCARSFWTTNSGAYWKDLVIKPSPAGGCTTSTNDPYSDAPDGPIVEKGGAAQILRQGNVPGNFTTGSSDLNRTVYTQDSTGLVDFTAAGSLLDSALVDFIRGKDVNNERKKSELNAPRPSIHGDVIHSRPLPVNYGDKGVTVYYGANDGMVHAVDTENKFVERWAFVAPEFFPRLKRLKSNSPQVNYPGLPTSITPTPERKDYFFDGSIGLYQNLANDRIFIYPTMRRGGRMIYALDVTKPEAPVFKWKAGCADLVGDANCTTGTKGIGQTWSMPKIVKIQGYKTNPVLIVGGGYDDCEDEDKVAPSCGSTKGGQVFVFDAIDGTLLKTFTTTRGVAADVSLLDVNSDGFIDYAYAADLGGSLYRMDFVDGPVTRTALPVSGWHSRKVAFTDGDGRKFLFGAAVVASAGKAYLAIGSGDREHPLEAQYPFNGVVNRFYVYKDDLTKGQGTDAIDMDVDLADYSANTTCDTPSVFPSSTLKGWFMDLNAYGKGEQTVTSALIVGGMVTFSTNRPVPAAVGTCRTSLGEAGGYWVNLFNASGAIGVDGTCGGKRRSTFVGGGLPPSPVVAVGVPVDGTVQTIVIGSVQKDGTPSALFDPQPMKAKPDNRRKRTYTNIKTE